MTERNEAIRRHMPVYGINYGHGVVWPRPDGQVGIYSAIDGKAYECGGPEACPNCRYDQDTLNAAIAKVEAENG